MKSGITPLHLLEITRQLIKSFKRGRDNEAANEEIGQNAMFFLQHVKENLRSLARGVDYSEEEVLKFIKGDGHMQFAPEEIKKLFPELLERT